jgi:peptidoglycan/LPS O-acetylase OafA/YrhL
MHKQAASGVHYPTLDIARGFAISIVLFYHVFWYVSFFRFGWIGVDLFFVLSGFLITDILLRSRENRSYFSNFYLKRILRILPLYYLTIFIFFTFAPIFFSNKSSDSTFTYYNQNQIWYWLFLQNWLVIWKGKPSEPYLQHFWSLAIEEQFYLFWPFIIVVFKHLETLKKLISLLILFAFLLRILTWMLYPQKTGELYYNTFSRMDSLLIGCLISIRLKQGKKIPKALIKIIFLGFITLVISSVAILGNIQQDNIIFSTIGYSLTAAFFGCAIYLLITYETKLSPLIKKLQVLIFLGKISYGLYVFHLPVYLITAYLLTNNSHSSLPLILRHTLFISIFSLLITFLLSIASFNILEKPILSFKKYLP